MCDRKKISFMDDSPISQDHKVEKANINCSTSDVQKCDKKRTFLIGVAGGTASGKSTVCQKIIKKLGKKMTERQVLCLSQDSFYRELTEKESQEAAAGKFNFDHPEALDHGLIFNCLQDIVKGRCTRVPKYDYKTNSRTREFHSILPADVVLFEGILVFYQKEVRDLFDMKLFVDTDADTRLARRVVRDTEDRGRDLETILNQYTTLVKPAFEEFCLPTKKFADVIIPRGADNEVAIDLIVKHIQDIILECNNHVNNRSRTNSESVMR